jgi:hypothetical protein
MIGPYKHHQGRYLSMVFRSTSSPLQRSKLLRGVPFDHSIEEMNWFRCRAPHHHPLPLLITGSAAARAIAGLQSDCCVVVVVGCETKSEVKRSTVDLLDGWNETKQRVGFFLRRVGAWDFSRSVMKNTGARLPPWVLETPLYLFGVTAVFRNHATAFRPHICSQESS